MLRDCPDIHSFFHFIQRVLAAWSILWQSPFLFSCAVWKSLILIVYGLWHIFFHFDIMEQSTAPRRHQLFYNLFRIFFLLQITFNLIWCFSFGIQGGATCIQMQFLWHGRLSHYWYIVYYYTKVCLVLSWAKYMIL